MPHVPVVPRDAVPPPAVRVRDFARLFLGRDDESAAKIIQRMCDRGELAHIRIGERGDRLVMVSELQRLADLAETNRDALAAAADA